MARGVGIRSVGAAALGIMLLAGSASAQRMPAVLSPLTAALPADEMPVSPIQHVGLILKVLEYDRNFDEQVGGEVRIVVVHRPDDPASASVLEAISSAFDAWAGKTVKNVPISYTRVPFTTAADVESAARSGGATMLYITPGNSSAIADLVRIGESLGILTSTGVPEYVERGVAVGVAQRADKPQIVINLRTSKSVGSEFDVSLLRIARVIR